MRRSEAEVDGMTNIDVCDFDQGSQWRCSRRRWRRGGSHDIVDPIKGKLPPRMMDPITPPMVPVLEKPKLAMESAIDVQKDIVLPDNPRLPMIGVKNSANVQPGARTGREAAAVWVRATAVVLVPATGTDTDRDRVATRAAVFTAWAAASQPR